MSIGYEEERERTMKAMGNERSYIYLLRIPGLGNPLGLRQS